MVIWLFAV